MRNGLSYLTVLGSVLFGFAAAAEQNLMREFATCTGRLSAEVEHSWLVTSADADRNETLYRDMASLLEAVTPPELEVKARSMRINAKAAHSRLLLQASFGWDANQRRFAERRAQDLLVLCSALLLADSRDGSVKIWATGTE